MPGGVTIFPAAVTIARSGSVAPSPATLGARIQRIRVRQGLSVRDLADRSGVNKNTILRLEKGLTPSYATLTRVCEALGIHVAQLTRPEPEEGETIALHQREREVRIAYPGEGAALALSEVAGGGQQPFAADEKVLLSVLTSRLPGGRINAAVLELFAESETVTHPGEEMVFCLRGAVRLTVAGRSYTLREGDAATFWCSERHSYAPAEEALASEEDLPVKLLSVWIDAREERERSGSGGAAE